MLLAQVRSRLADESINPQTLVLDSTFVTFKDSFAEIDTKFKQ